MTDFWVDSMTIIANLSDNIWQTCTILTQVRNPAGNMVEVSTLARLSRSRSSTDKEGNFSLDLLPSEIQHTERFYLSGYYLQPPLRAVANSKDSKIRLWDGQIFQWYPETNVESAHPIVTRLLGVPLSGWAYLR